MFLVAKVEILTTLTVGFEKLHYFTMSGHVSGQNKHCHSLMVNDSSHYQYE